ncbi:DUF6385 domain-containing protein [Kyrpidia tusciae]|uniref:DUF6385 domain-containing protein n=1 Tax=Kyrpidia tusciae (strain DSM 2912 / NBRC 15312 / T2) TaxID=562970 RepID=D5WXJ4_KYRT2|nr:DUF6385 domain-containing protein [Kyrpidia tusciae]ADG05915.1 conserved hypothetical protein [Kyrpidia tusciae DSM 2912]
MFRQFVETYTTSDQLTGSNFIELAGLNIYTFVVINAGTAPATVGVQVSPDQGTLIADGLLESVAPQGAVALVPRLFLRYARVVFQSAEPGRPTDVIIVFNGQ